MTMSRTFARFVAPTQGAVLTRGLKTTPARLFPGSQGATMHGNDGETLEKEKQKNLKGEQHDDHSSAPMKHAPGWNQNLASKSEAQVKADKHPGSPQDLQQETAEKANKQA